LTHPSSEGNFVEIHEAKKKVIQCLRVFHDPKGTAREIEIELTDGTELSIEIHAQTEVTTRFCSTQDGDFRVIQEYATRPNQSQ
jgi:hypothetical protein